MTALKAMTIWPAWQHFEEDRKGTIEVGKIADFVILSNDPTAIDPERLDQIDVLVTIKDGAVVYEAERDTRTGELRRSPFMADPVTAHRFLHVMYQAMGVERPVTGCLLRPAVCQRLIGVSTSRL
jgi:adenine deaminase